MQAPHELPADERLPAVYSRFIRVIAREINVSGGGAITQITHNTIHDSCRVSGTPTTERQASASGGPTSRDGRPYSCITAVSVVDSVLGPRPTHVTTPHCCWHCTSAAVVIATKPQPPHRSLALSFACGVSYRAPWSFPDRGRGVRASGHGM